MTMLAIRIMKTAIIKCSLPETISFTQRAYTVLGALEMLSSKIIPKNVQKWQS